MSIKDIRDEDVDNVTGIVAGIFKAVCGIARLVDNIKNRGSEDGRESQSGKCK